jgi:ribonuclease-3
MYSELQSKLGYNFKNIELLKLALVHKSYSNTSNNERLEFLGDSILNTVISQYLFLKFSNEKEGLLTRMRAYLVKAETLTMKAEELSLIDHIRLSKGTANLSRERKNSILEDSFEATIGAIFLDSSWDQVNLIVLSLFNNELNSLSADMSFKDPKTELQELLQSMKLDLTPVYY